MQIYMVKYSKNIFLDQNYFTEYYIVVADLQKFLTWRVFVLAISMYKTTINTNIVLTLVVVNFLIFFHILTGNSSAEVFSNRQKIVQNYMGFFY